MSPFSRQQLKQTVLAQLTCLYEAHWTSQSGLQRRRCAFLASPRNTEKAQRAGNISGAIQHCAQTECCMGFFRLEPGHPVPDLLGCSITETFCPETSCHASIHHQNYLRCVCSSDFCNSNITLNNQAKQTQHSHTSDLLSVSVLVIPAGALVILLFLISAAKGKHLVKDCSSETPPYAISEECDFDLGSVELQKVVACGHFAYVRQGYFQGSSVALKVFPETLKQDFTKEKNVYMLPFMTHYGIIQFLGVGRMGKELVLVLELATQGSLNAFLSKTVCDWTSTVKLAQTLSQGLAYLHTELNKNGVYKPAIAHCDLSSSNVLVKADGSCALCDFGCSMVLQCFGNCPAMQDHSSGKEGRIQMGTLQYMSPEILEGCVNLSSGQCLLQGDVYSLGLLLWELIMRCSDLLNDSPVPAHMLPFEAELGTSPSLEDLLIFVSEQRRRPSVPAQWGQVIQGFSLHELLEDCWDHDADARLTAQCTASRLASLPFDLTLSTLGWIWCLIVLALFVEHHEEYQGLVHGSTLNSPRFGREALVKEVSSGARSSYHLCSEFSAEYPRTAGMDARELAQGQVFGQQHHSLQSVSEAVGRPQLVAQLAGDIQGLTNLVQTSLEPASLPSQVTSPYPMDILDTYSGDPELCEGFLFQCSVYLCSQGTSTDQAKVAFLVSRLAGEALDWAIATWEELSVEPFSEYLKHFKAVFQRPRRGLTPGDLLLWLKQGSRSVAHYALEFRSVAARSGWSHAMLAAQFRNGLAPRLQQELACRGGSLELDELITLAIRLDQLPGRPTPTMS
ncbi:anti-Muellerian hormone type-2 receptor-like [Salminus brasiliensis]|uniref:anti-Muellerian hormone type-2 receptor-like n=1 Tax=Salminus brasiliensis TaxID=930266 RepID=UPI003B832038